MDSSELKVGDANGIPDDGLLELLNLLFLLFDLHLVIIAKISLKC